MKMGAMCFLVISLEFEEFYRVPWIVFREMKKIYGHKYMNLDVICTCITDTRQELHMKPCVAGL